MTIFKRSTLFLTGLLFLLVVSSCGSATTTGSQGSQSTTSQTAPAATIKTASATVNGKAVTVLTNAQGMTLYYFTPDTSTKTACTGGCAGAWPPLLFTGSGSPSAAKTLPGSLEVYANANGKQVTCNDHPLYTFTGDTAPVRSLEKVLQVNGL